MIMRDWGLWDRIKWDEVKRNIKEGVIEKEKELVGDTTHYHAYSGFGTVTYEEEGKEHKKSQSKVTKRCNCEDWEDCPHPWILADDGAGTIVKSKSKIIWGHNQNRKNVVFDCGFEFMRRLDNYSKAARPSASRWFGLVRQSSGFQQAGLDTPTSTLGVPSSCGLSLPENWLLTYDNSPDLFPSCEDMRPAFESR
ncbi:MAG: hypothetical protein LWX55_03245 [Deltaproteobacteria bacterium]|jgi:hypothetical protein|nr:hypothetical protein [Deltaproteobacteria bacterium]